MGKYVYLYELDSVRKTDEEILTGQKALYNEIVGNGNTVVLTFNQLVDSRGFFSLLEDETYYNSIISLFEKGKIKISQYGEIRTVTQYLLNAIDEEKQFIYSALPLKFTQKRLTAMVRRCLMFSDLSEINGYLNGGFRSDSELTDLFIEVADSKCKQTVYTVAAMRDILENLYTLLKMILRISPMHHIYVTPKNRSEYKGLSYHEILNAALEIDNQGEPLWSGAVGIIRKLDCLGNDNRSVYVREIFNRYMCEGNGLEDVYSYAQAIVSLCYNYSCEASISNVSKHYDSQEIALPTTDMTSFASDFLTRLSLEWNGGKDRDKRYLNDESNDFIRYVRPAGFPDFREAVRISGYISDKSVASEITRYEFRASENKRRYKRKMLLVIAKRLMLSMACVGIACGLDLLFNGLQGILEGFLNISTESTVLNIAFTVIETLVIIIAAELLTTFISYRFKGFLSLSDALSGVLHLFRDAVVICLKKMETYHNPSDASVDKKEKCSTYSHIDLVRPKRITDYINTVNSQKESDIFAESEEYPIADVNDKNVVDKLMRSEELFMYKFGTVYKSRYNTLMVDPVINREGDIYPYERIVPTAGNGVVTVPVYEGKFILLHQARHAVRAVQYSFPRGFAEPDEKPEDTAVRELEEEIGAEIIGSPVFLGSVAADSGLTSCRANVYAVNVKSYNVAPENEGIKSVHLISEAELCNMIKQGDIDDGFTLSAYTLYKQRTETE